MSHTWPNNQSMEHMTNRPTPSPILPLKIPMFDPDVLKIHANIKNAISTLQEIGVGEHDGDVRFLTESRIVAVSRMRNEKKYAIWPLLVAESPKFLHLIGNRDRGTRR